MNKIFSYFVKRHMFANVLTIMIILLGLAVLPSINRDTFPSVDLDEVVMVTNYPGSSPEDIELKITNKIEDKLKGIEGIKKYTSFSIENVSLISIILESDADDPDEVKDKIREQVDSITDFPQDLENRPDITEISSSSFPVLEVGLSSKDLTYSQLRNIAKSFKNDLEEIKGVNSVDGYGYLAKEMRITPSPDLLEYYQVSMMDLISTISGQNIRASMGNIVQRGISSTIVNDNRFLNEKDVSNAIVRSNFNGKNIRVSDVAVVRLGFEDPTILSKVSGENGISFNVIKNSSADIITVSNKILDLVKIYQEKYPELTFVTANDFSKYLKNRLKVMINNGILGLILVNLVLWFFLDLRTAFWVSLGIPVAVMGVFFLMPPLDMTINIISLLALIIVIGIIVDDGIIVAENIAKFREEGLSNIESSVQGIQTVFKPVITTILTTIIAFSPMFFMSGIMGKFIFQIPLVITCALLISLIEVVVALPSHLAAQKKTAKKEFKLRHKLILKLRQSYERILLKFLKNKYRVVLGFVLFFFGTIFYAGAFMNFVLFPESSAVRFYVRTEAPAGTSLQETAKRLLPIEKEIMKLPNNELLAFTTRVGMTGDSYFLAEQENLGIIMVDLIPFSGRDRSAREIMEEIKLKTENTKGFNRITYQVDAGGPPVGKAINIRVITDNNDLRTNVANQVYKFVSSLDGVVSTDRDDKKQKKQMEIKLNKKAISQLGLNIATIQQVIRTGYSGFYASSIRLGDEDIFFNIEMSEQNKSSLSVLRNLAIPNQQGRLIRLKSIAKIRMVPGSPNFNHYNGKRSVSITGDINSKIITSTQVTKIVSKKFNSSTFPNVQFEFGGESEETNKSVQDLIRSFVLAVIGIFFLLILLFNSLSQPFIVLLTIPFGLIGVIIAFAIHGQDLGFISMVGAVGLTGVVVNDSLVLVNHLNQKKTSIKTKKELIPEIIQGSGDRFRPIMITSCSTVAGLLPLAYGLGGADPFIAPMALAIGYGLLFSTPLTLFLLPALFLIQIELVEVYVKLRKKIKRFRIFKKLKLKF